MLTESKFSGIIKGGRAVQGKKGVCVPRDSQIAPRLPTVCGIPSPHPRRLSYLYVLYMTREIRFMMTEVLFVGYTISRCDDYGET